MRAVDERAPEAVGDDAVGVALDDLAVEDVGAVSAVPGQFVAVPVELGVGGGARGDHLEERQLKSVVYQPAALCLKGEELGGLAR